MNGTAPSNSMETPVIGAEDLDGLPLGAWVVDRDGLSWQHQFDKGYGRTLWRADHNHAATSAQLAGGSRTPLTIR